MVLKAVPDALSGHIHIQDNSSRNQEQKEECNNSQSKIKAFNHHLTEQKGCCGHWGISGG